MVHVLLKHSLKDFSMTLLAGEMSSVVWSFEQAIKLANYCFMDSGRIHETLGSETKNIIIEATRWVQTHIVYTQFALQLSNPSPKVQHLASKQQI